MKNFFDILLLKSFSSLTKHQIYLRFLWRMCINVGILLVALILILFVSFFLSCDSNVKEAEIRAEYRNLVYPEDTTIYGVVRSISTEKVKRFGDFLYSNSNNIIIQSDTVIFSVYVDKFTFNIKDSVKIIIQRTKHEGEFNDILTTIYPNFGEPTKTYWAFTNLYYKELMLDKIEKLK